MAGIVHKIEEALHIGGGDQKKAEAEKHQKAEVKQNKEGEGFVDKIKDKFPHGGEGGEKNKKKDGKGGEKKKKEKKKHGEGHGHSSSSSDSD